MKPLSAVALFVFLLILGLTWVTWITASAKVLGIIAIVVGFVILLDTFWLRSEGWVARREVGP